MKHLVLFLLLSSTIGANELVSIEQPQSAAAAAAEPSADGLSKDIIMALVDDAVKLKRYQVLLAGITFMSYPERLAELKKFAQEVNNKDVLNFVDKCSRLPIHIAAAYGIVSLLQDVPNEHVNTVDSEGYTPLMHAVSEKWTAQDREGHTPFLHTERTNKLDCIKILLKKGAHVNVQARDGSTPLLAAIFAGVEIVDLLLQHGANTEFCADYETPLIVATRYGRDQCIPSLLKAGANMHARDAGGYTPYMIAKGNCWRLLNEAMEKEYVAQAKTCSTSCTLL